MTTHSTATIQSTLFGDSKGTSFNDLETVIGSANVTINTAKPIKEIKIMHGGAIDGLKVTYYKGSGTTSITHGTSADCTASGLTKSTITIADKETIVAISGLHGSSSWGTRVIALSFAIYNSSTGKLRLEGPFGGSGGTAFRVTANGNFVGFGGYATNTDDNLATVTTNTEEGGLYGLTFAEVAYRSV